MAAQIFGLDIGSSLIKIAEVKGNADHRQLVAIGMTPTPGKGVLSESDPELQVIAKAVRDLVHESKVSTLQVVASLPESQIFTRVIEMPILTDNELQSAIKYEAEQYIPIPLTDVKVDFQVLSRSSNPSANQKMEVLLVAAPNALIKRFLQIIHLAGLKPYALETEITASARSLVVVDNLAPTSMILDIGATTSKISIIADKKISFTRSLAFGGTALTRAVSQGLGFEFEQAEQYKNTYGLDSSQLEGKIAQAIKPIFDVVTNELQRAMVYWAGKYPDKSIKRLVVTGGSAKLPGLIPYLTQVTGLEGQLADTWGGTSFGASISPSVREESPFYSIAMGLAMKDILGG